MFLFSELLYMLLINYMNTAKLILLVRHHVERITFKIIPTFSVSAHKISEDMLKMKTESLMLKE